MESFPALTHLAVAADGGADEFATQLLQPRADRFGLLDPDRGAVDQDFRARTGGAGDEAVVAEIDLFEILARRHHREHDVLAGKLVRTDRRSARPSWPAARPWRASGSRSPRNGRPSTAARPSDSPFVPCRSSRVNVLPFFLLGFSIAVIARSEATKQSSCMIASRRSNPSLSSRWIASLRSQ